MIVMISNATGFDAGLLAGLYPGQIGHLFSPGAQRGPWPEVPYALDNGAYTAFLSGEPWDESRWLVLLRWAALAGPLPLWALVPDVVGNRERTIASWERYAHVVRRFGFRAAFALQDGMTFADVPDEECVLFVGGSSEWKDAAIVPWCARFPGRVHVGRVNGWERLHASWKAGAISVDGTGWFHKTNSKNASQFNTLRKFLRETKGDHALSAVA
jgi:hypothetical protein